MRALFFEPPGPSGVAGVCLQLGILVWLDKALTRRDTGLASLENDPLFLILHDDDRWPVLLARVALADGRRSRGPVWGNLQGHQKRDNSVLVALAHCGE